MKKVYSYDFKYKLYERILALERKYSIQVPDPDIIENMIDSPNVYQSLDWRISNLEFNLGEPVRNLLDYDKRIESLEEHTPAWIGEGVKRVALIEKQLGIEAYIGQSLEDRLAALSKATGIYFNTNTLNYLRIDKLWKAVFKTKKDGNSMNMNDSENVPCVTVDLDTSKAVTAKEVSKQMKHFNLVEKFKKFLKEQNGILSSDTKNIIMLLPYLLKLQAQKSSVYGRSYCRHGDLSIFLNTERKWDRISNIMDTAMEEGMNNLYEKGTATETFFDTVVDLASYSLLWVGYIIENHPEVFNKFIQDNKLEFTNDD